MPGFFHDGDDRVKHDDTIALARWLAARAYPGATWDRLPGEDVKAFVRMALALLDGPPPVLVRKVLEDR